MKRRSYNGATGCHGPCALERVAVDEDTVTERGEMAARPVVKLRDVM